MFIRLLTRRYITAPTKGSGEDDDLSDDEDDEYQDSGVTESWRWQPGQQAETSTEKQTSTSQGPRQGTGDAGPSSRRSRQTKRGDLKVGPAVTLPVLKAPALSSLTLEMPKVDFSNPTFMTQGSAPAPADDRLAGNTSEEGGEDEEEQGDEK